MAKKENKGCIFCRIARKEIPAEIVYEDRNFLAFLDIKPATKKGGHTLVIPKKHYDIITDMPSEELAGMMVAVKKVSGALMKISEGLNILQNNKKAAGQFVNHVHFHLIPRYRDDHIVIEKWKECEYKGNRINEVSEKIRNLLK
ncbi:MAG: HIT family protein [archaeon]